MECLRVVEFEVPYKDHELFQAFFSACENWPPECGTACAANDHAPVSFKMELTETEFARFKTWYQQRYSAEIPVT